MDEKKKKKADGEQKERKKNWREVYATVEDIKAFLSDRIFLRHNVITGRVEYRLPSSYEHDGTDWQPINDRIEYMRTDSQAKVVLTEETIQEALLTPLRTSLNLATPERRCYMIYTSGSTGKPKGVVINQASVTAYIAWLVRAYDYSPGKRNLHHPSFSFDASTMDIFLPIASGGETHILSEDLRKDLGGMARYIKEHQIYGSTMSTAIGMALLNTYDLDLHYIMLGGEKFMPVKRTATKLFNGYGPTEFTCASSYHIIDQDKEGDIPIGRAVPNSASYICDPEGQLLPQGVAGELCLSGIQIAQGYWGREDLTNQKFVQCPFNNSLAPDASYSEF